MIGDADGIYSSPDDVPSVPSSPSSQGTHVAALNLAKVISLSRMLYPSHEASPGSSLVAKARSQPGFLLILAGAQENLTKACEILRTTIEQAQLL
jgi:hypothetical protein